MRVVFDTNICISAFAIPGGQAEEAYLHALRGRFELCTSVPIEHRPIILPLVSIGDTLLVHSSRRIVTSTVRRRHVRTVRHLALTGVFLPRSRPRHGRRCERVDQRLTGHVRHPLRRPVIHHARLPLQPHVPSPSCPGTSTQPRRVAPCPTSATLDRLDRIPVIDRARNG
jgi:hypothetical protein